GPGGEHLADLDVQRPELLQRLADGPGPLLLAVGPVLAVAAHRGPQADGAADLAGQEPSHRAGHVPGARHVHRLRLSPGVTPPEGSVGIGEVVGRPAPAVGRAPAAAPLVVVPALPVAVAAPVALLAQRPDHLGQPGGAAEGAEQAPAVAEAPQPAER